MRENILILVTIGLLLIIVIYPDIVIGVPLAILLITVEHILYL